MIKLTQNNIKCSNIIENTSPASFSMNSNLHLLSDEFIEVSTEPEFNTVTGTSLLINNTNVLCKEYVEYALPEFPYIWYDATEPSSYPGTGTTLFDISGNNIHGTLMNGVGYTSGNSGSLVFDGTDDYVKVPIALTLNDISVSVVVKGNLATMIRAFFETAVINTTKSTQPLLLFGVSNTNRFFSFAPYVYVNDPRYTANKFFTFTITRKRIGTTSQWTENIYLNGMLCINRTAGLAGGLQNEQFNIGVGYQGYWDGNIAATIIHNRELNIDEVEGINGYYRNKINY